MNPTFLQRLRAASGIIFKSAANFPFNWVPPSGGYAASDLTKPYEQSVWVMRAIKKISGPIAAVPLYFETPDGEEVNDPALDAFWNQPARGLTRHDFIEASVGWLKLKGETFWLLGDDALRPFPEVPSLTPLIVARPDQMREKLDRGELVGWEWRPNTGRSQLLLPAQVVQSKFWNPYDDLRGLAEYLAAQVAAEADFAAGEYSRNLMANNGDTGPIISNKAGMLTDEQQKQILSQLRMKQELARRGEFRAAFLTSDVTVQNPTAQTVDAAFAAMRIGNRHEIFLAFGVPPSMADKMESYSIGSASDWFMLITETCIPTSHKLAAAISQVVRQQTGLELKACFDWDEHPVMQAVRRERLDSVEKLWSKGMPMADINEYLALGMDDFDGWEVGYLPFSVAPVSESLAPAAPPETSPAFAEEETPVTEALRALKSRVRSPASRAGLTPDSGLRTRDCPCSLDLSALEIRATDSQAVKKWKSIVAKRRETIRAYESKFNAVLMTARREVLGKLERAAQLTPDSGLKTQDSGLSTRAAAADFLFNLDAFTRVFKVSMRNVAASALQSAGDQLYAEIAKDDPWKMPAPKAIEFLHQRENKLANVPNDIFERVKATLEEGLTAGDPLKKIATAVRGTFNDISDGRAMVIAQTETAAAYGVGRHEAMKSAGVQWKQWLTSGNSNIRPAHKLMNDVTLSVAEPFIVVNSKTGEVDEVMHPADPGGAPWNVINCHCVEIAVATGPEGEVEPSV